MSEKMALSEIERRIYTFFTEDGLIDLAIGLVIFGFGGLLYLDLPAFTGILGVVPLGLWYMGKRFITVPRIGIIRPGHEVKSKLKGFLVTMLIVGAGVLPLFFLMSAGGQSSGYSALLLFALLLAVAISALGLVLRVNRLYYYAVILFFCMSVGALFNGAAGDLDTYVLAVMAAGIIILLSGSGVMFRFLKRYPVVKGEACS